MTESCVWEYSGIQHREIQSLTLMMESSQAGPTITLIICQRIFQSRGNKEDDTGVPVSDCLTVKYRLLCMLLHIFCYFYPFRYINRHKIWEYGTLHFNQHNKMCIAVLNTPQKYCVYRPAISRY